MSSIMKVLLSIIVILLIFLFSSTINAQSTDQVDNKITDLEKKVTNSITQISEAAKFTKANEQRLDTTLSCMLTIFTIIFTIITLLLMIIGFLIWTHINQAKEANDILDEIKEKRKKIEETGFFILEAAKKQKDEQLSAKEFSKKINSTRGFSPILYRAYGHNEVYAIDEYGDRHWIPSPSMLGRMGYTWNDVKEISKEELEKINIGKEIPDLTKRSS